MSPGSCSQLSPPLVFQLASWLRWAEGPPGTQAILPSLFLPTLPKPGGCRVASGRALEQEWPWVRANPHHRRSRSLALIPSLKGCGAAVPSLPLCAWLKETHFLHMAVTHEDRVAKATLVTSGVLQGRQIPGRLCEPLGVGRRVSQR